MKYAIIGCGLIGKKRAALLPAGAVLATCDTNVARAATLAAQCTQGDFDAPAVYGDFTEAVRHPGVDAVIVSTTNAQLAPIALAAIEAGRHVLVEKPGAINGHQLQEMHEAARRCGVKVRIGFNHRYHPAFLKAREIYESGALGDLLFIRARYGHGGRVGYDREWRADASLSGGGELIDQGVHLIDLAQWFLGSFAEISGHASTLYWDMPVDDNAFVSLRTVSGQTAWLQVSCTEWKNLFSFEIYGRQGKLHVEGLGGSYGIERLYHYRMLPEMGPPETTIYEYPRGDASWKIEMEQFAQDIQHNREPSPGLSEAIAILHVVETVYERSGYVKGANPEFGKDKEPQNGEKE
ncbi:LmbZ [Verrucomicrobia bacterium LW23]|nr:LmbZ [Verrucomicrobia bacterium LW23]